jgi:hypothetical protein
MSLDGRGATGSEAYLLMALHPQQESIPALPPPESQKTTIWRRWKSTKLQVRPHFEWLVVASRVGPFLVLVLPICCRATSEFSEPGLPG